MYTYVYMYTHTYICIYVLPHAYIKNLQLVERQSQHGQIDSFSDTRRQRGWQPNAAAIECHTLVGDPDVYTFVCRSTYICGQKYMYGRLLNCGWCYA